jgi:glycosyltransferase involved in cell wall biosynthesis
LTIVKKVRVLSVIGNLNVGGTETFLSRIVPEVNKHGVEMEICALERTGPLLRPLEERGIVVHGTPYSERARRSNTLTLLRTIDSIRRLVHARRFDIVHTYLFWSDVLGVAGAKLGGCRRVIIGRRALHAWAHSDSAFFHGLEQTANLFADEVLANSEAVLRDAEANESRLPRIRGVIYNGVDVGQYEPACLRPDGALRLVTVGALAPRKGQEFLVEALARVTADGMDVTLELVGSGPDEAMLRRMAEAAGVAGRIRFAGEQSDPRGALARADIFVLPSRQEGFSNALLEAMASALPVVATDVGGNSEAVVDGEGGRLVRPGDPLALAAAISELGHDRGRLVAMGRTNRQRVEAKFSLEVSARNLAGWYLRGGEGLAR